MSISATVSTGFGLQRYGICLCYKFFNTDFKTIKSGLISNYGEFAIIKIGILHLFPDTNKFKCISIAKPISDEEISIFCFEHICDTDIILFSYFYYINFRILNSNLCHLKKEFLITSQIYNFSIRQKPSPVRSRVSTQCAISLLAPYRPSIPYKPIYPLYPIRYPLHPPALPLGGAGGGYLTMW